MVFMTSWIFGKNNQQTSLFEIVKQQETSFFSYGHKQNVFLSNLFSNGLKFSLDKTILFLSC